ncbi:MAG: HPF/RaiA family ribosome-associated protein [Proteobacteria bacterium]|nr:HPF/RaiA family ribosome-associated protein [Pseudomonadota bacterium]
MSFQIHFHDGLPHSKRLQADCELRSRELQGEFPETHKFVISCSRSGERYEVHIHVTGKEGEVASSATHWVQQEAVQQAFSKAQRQLRKRHDKLIHSRRRGAQRHAAS